MIKRIYTVLRCTVLSAVLISGLVSVAHAEAVQ